MQQFVGIYLCSNNRYGNKCHADVHPHICAVHIAYSTAILTCRCAVRFDLANEHTRYCSPLTTLHLNISVRTVFANSLKRKRKNGMPFEFIGMNVYVLHTNVSILLFSGFCFPNHLICISQRQQTIA